MTPGKTPQAVLDEILQDEVLLEKLRQAVKRRGGRGLNICLMGADGSGKTTLAEQLSRLYEEAGIESRRHHIYSFHHNILLTPFIILSNRYVRRRVLIFDRTIYDNIAVFFFHWPKLKWMQPLWIHLARLFYPRFDAHIYLQASLDETLARRPEVTPRHYIALTSAYDPILRLCGFRVFQSRPELLRKVVEALSASSRG